jgi:hypothetical protein
VIFVVKEDTVNHILDGSGSFLVVFKFKLQYSVYVRIGISNEQNKEQKMFANIACSYSNCTNPVVGQCTGYKGDCQKYYCATHSTDTLCHSCASKKLTEENEALAKQEYLKIIGGLRKGARSIAWKIFWRRNETQWGIGVILFLGLLGLIIGVNNDTGTFFLGLGGFGVAIGILTLFSEIGKQEKTLATGIDQQKNGFLNFFTAWKIEQQKKTWSAIGAVVGFIFIIILAGLVSEANKSSEDTRIRKAIDEELDRRG